MAVLIHSCTAFALLVHIRLSSQRHLRCSIQYGVISTISDRAMDFVDSYLLILQGLACFFQIARYDNQRALWWLKPYAVGHQVHDVSLTMSCPCSTSNILFSVPAIDGDKR